MTVPDPGPSRRPPPPPPPARRVAGPGVPGEVTKPSLAAESSWRFAGHEILRELARGGLGVVFLARHPLLDELRAIKRPLDHAGIDSAMIIERFQREVRAVGRLRHDHIIRAHDAGSDQHGPYLVMEYLDGLPLSSLVQRLGPLPVPLACELARQAALGLQAAHEAKMIHRDIKPSNLMLARHGSGARVVIIDWGLVKWSEDTARYGTAANASFDLTMQGTTVGTVGYVSPEQLRAEQRLDSRADLFSLGIALGVLLTGKEARQWSSGLPEAVHRAGESPRIAALRHLRRDLPTGLSAVIAKMIDEFPERRFSEPQAAADALQRYSNGISPQQLRQVLDHDSPVILAEPVIHPQKRRQVQEHNSPMIVAEPVISRAADADSVPVGQVSTVTHPAPVAPPRQRVSLDRPAGTAIRPRLSTWSVVAGYLGLSSLVCVPAGPLAIAAGVMGLRQIRNSPSLAGRARAWTGLVTGTVGSLGFAFALLVFDHAMTQIPEPGLPPQKVVSEPGYWEEYVVPVEVPSTDGGPATMVPQTRKRWMTGPPGKRTETQQPPADLGGMGELTGDDLFGDSPVKKK